MQYGYLHICLVCCLKDLYDNSITEGEVVGGEHVYIQKNVSG